MTEYLRLSLQIDKLRRQLKNWCASGVISAEVIGEMFDAACAKIRLSAGESNVEWVADRLHDLAFEAGMAEVDSSVLRMVRSGLIPADEVLGLLCEKDGPRRVTSTSLPTTPYFNCMREELSMSLAV